MTKGYWIGRVEVTNPDGYQSYVRAARAMFGEYGARVLVSGGRFETLEGAARGRNVVIEFADYDTALACYKSQKYQAAKALRAGAVVLDLIVVEGYDGVQP
jgi:uncharacterized protein (DUF1330 family)